MTSYILSTLRLAQVARARLSTVSTLELPDVYDPFTSSIVTMWRKDGSNKEVALHGIASRVGGFPAALARYFIAAYSEPKDVVLDPFCGKGTALLEAARLGRNAIGGDVAYDAVVLSRAKCCPVTIAEASNYIEQLPQRGRPAFSGVPKEVALFFNRKTLGQILLIRRKLLSDMSSRSSKTRRIATFTCALMLGVLHGHSELSLSLPCNQCFAMSPNYVRRYMKKHGLKKPIRDVKACLLKKALEMLPAPRNMAFASIEEGPAQECHLYTSDVKPRPSLVITSPPYLDRQTYSKDAWLRLWFLGREHNGSFDKSLETGSLRVFIEGMVQALSSIWRSVKPNGHVVLVCGKAGVDVRKTIQVKCKRGRRKVENRKKVRVRISDLCLLALEQVNKQRRPFSVESIYIDRVMMKRGSYFAVHSGLHTQGNGKVGRRYGEDEIIVLKRLPQHCKDKC